MRLEHKFLWDPFIRMCGMQLAKHINNSRRGSYHVSKRCLSELVNRVITQCWVFGSVVAVAFQIAFRAEKHANNIFFIF